MARRRYYRSRRVYPRQKWLPVNNEIVVPAQASIDSGYYSITYSVVTQNSTRTAADGSGNVSNAAILKCGRFKFKGTLSTNGSTSYIIGLAYIPEGYSINSGTSISNNELGGTFFYRHPEWVLAWTRVDYLQTTENEVSLSSRLKRNLNTGDGIILFKININRGSSIVNASVLQGTVSYVCRTN